LWSFGSEAYGNDIASRRCRAGWMNSSVPDH
jgi:hypothetical protein